MISEDISGTGTPVQVIGSPLEPAVRKVLVCLHLKGISCRIDPRVATLDSGAFTRVIPPSQVPILRHGEVTLRDSAAICQYLDERFPATPLYPHDAVSRARALRLENYADTHLAEVIIGHFYNELTIRPTLWGEPADQVLVDTALHEEIPQILDYLESELPADGYFCGAPSIADIAVAAYFRNAWFVRFRIDPIRWPRSALLMDQMFGSDAFLHLKPVESLLLRTPLRSHREALAHAGFALMPEVN